MAAYMNTPIQEPQQESPPNIHLSHVPNLDNLELPNHHRESYSFLNTNSFLYAMHGLIGNPNETGLMQYC